MERNTSINIAGRTVMCVLQVVMFISAPWYPTRWTVNETKCSSDASVWLLSAPNVLAVGGTLVFQCTYNDSYLASLFVSTTGIDCKWTDAKVRYCVCLSVCIVYLVVLHLLTGRAVKWLATERAVGLQVEFPLSIAGLDCVWSKRYIPCVLRFVWPGIWWTVRPPAKQCSFLFSRTSKPSLGPTFFSVALRPNAGHGHL